MSKNRRGGASGRSDKGTAGATHPSASATTAASLADAAARPAKAALPPLPDVVLSMSFAERCDEALRVARRLFELNPSWEMLFRDVLGSDGLTRRLFSDAASMSDFERTNAFLEIRQMIAELRRRSTALEEREPQKVITVRLPKSLHEALQVEAASRNVSVNKLCISKLLQAVDDEVEPRGETSPGPALKARPAAGPADDETNDDETSRGEHAEDDHAGEE